MKHVLALVFLLLTPTLAAAWDKLVTPPDLAALTDVTILDIRAPAAYAAGHVPGAINAPYPFWRGPAENPGEALSDDRLTTLLQTLGLFGDERIVITYAGANTSDFGAATRVYWTLKSAGFETLAILSGGLAAYAAEDLPLSTEATVPRASDATFALADTWMIDRAGVADLIAGAREGQLIDARPARFFVGQTAHPVARMPGTLEGAKNLAFTRWFDGDADPATLADGIVGEAEGDIVSFCNTGHWASINWFALSELAGKENVKLYPESMVGWTAHGGEAVRGTLQN
ncbi:MAG: rhodanese-like domain-containing protein [Pseudomonadota bacterium]